MVVRGDPTHPLASKKEWVRSWETRGLFTAPNGAEVEMKEDDRLRSGSLISAGLLQRDTAGDSSAGRAAEEA